MNKKHKKILLLTVKLLVAAGLLTWVISKVHWDNYVVDKQGHEFAAPGTQVNQPQTGTIQVIDGRLWWKNTRQMPVEDFAPIPVAGGTTTQPQQAGAMIIHKGFRDTLFSLNRPLLIVGVFGFLLSTMIIVVRWWFLLRIQDIHITLWEAVRLTFLGIFFNTVIPGTVGGDLVKAYYVSKHTPRKAAVLVSVFVDRVLGMTELTLLACLMLTIVLVSGRETFAAVKWPAIMAVAVLGLVILTLAFVLSARFRQLFHLQKIYQKMSFAKHIAAASDAAKLYRQRIGKLAKAVLITFGAHIVWVMALFVVGQSLSLTAPWYTYFIYIPLIYIIGAIPLAPGGVGIIEQSFVAFFAVCPASEVLALALLARLIPIFWGLPGVIVAITGPRLPKADVMEAELEAP